ncbi:MAG: iron chaperone [Clostridia bacterium]|nr:iron chaperone [Clostridia bacterium]
MEEYLSTITNQGHRARLGQIFEWIRVNFPSLQYKILWKQPMFLEHDTFIIGFSAAKGHLSVSPEAKGIERFAREIAAAGYSQTKNLFRIEWEQPVDYRLLHSIIDYNMADKRNCSDFWRK